MFRFSVQRGGVLVLQQGDLCKWKGPAIVNAANERMLGGGGVDGAIHRAAGPELLQECKRVPVVRPGVRCPTGEARLTKAYNLPADFVIHTVGPIYKAPKSWGPLGEPKGVAPDSEGESARLLRNCYRNCLLLANEKHFDKVAFPAISCGVYGYPLDEASTLACEAVRESIGEIKEVHFVLFGTETFEAFHTSASAAFDAI